jgi:hypothetical protein
LISFHFLSRKFSSCWVEKLEEARRSRLEAAQARRYLVSIGGASPLQIGPISCGCTPEDAFRSLMGNDLDLLVIGNCALKKSAQNTGLKQDFSSAFELDWGGATSRVAWGRPPTARPPISEVRAPFCKSF